MAEQPQVDYSPIFTEFNTILRDLEEKQNILKDRTLLIGQNLIESRENFEKKILEIRKDVESLKQAISSIKISIETISEQTQNFARKDELAVLYRHAKIFDPLKFATMEDIQRLMQKNKNP